MKRIIFTLLVSAALFSVVPVAAQENADDIKAQIESLQKQLDEVEKSDNPSDTVQLGEIETEGAIFNLKEAHYFLDEKSTSGKSLLLIIEYTNKKDKANTPTSAIIWDLKAEQESDIQVFDLNNASIPRDLRGPDTYKNRGIELKPGATILVEYAYKIEVDSPITISASRLANSQSEDIVIDLNNLTEFKQ